MKRLFLWLLAIVMAIIAGYSLAQAAPFLVCDPQAGVDYYQITGDPYWTTAVTAQADGSLHTDLGTIAIGSHTVQVRACKAASTTEVGGCSDPTPFTFSKSKPALPVNMRVVP